MSKNNKGDDMWTKMDKLLTRFEKKGFQFANKAHIWTINVILVGLTYGTYTFFRDYNEFFKAGRVYLDILV
jgi:hypothetical protein